MPRQEYHLGRLLLEPRRRLLLDGHMVPLGRKALDILSVLADAEGALVTKDELMAAVWPGLVIEENAIQVHVAALRKALGAESGRLVTLRGLGYQLDLDDGPKGPMKVVPERRSAAVLPFVNLTGDPGKEYLGDGLAEELISVLARASDLHVPARTSTFAYKGHNVDVRQIGRDLGVDTVLEGSVRSAGERIRITAQLIDTRDGFHLWAQTYDRRFEDLFALQDELASAIAGGLRAHLAPHAKPTQDLEAFHLYLQARGLAWQPAKENVVRAIALLDQAITRDDRFAQAYSSLAWVINLGIGHNFLTSDRYTDVSTNAERAIALDPLLAEGHAMLGTFRAVMGNWLGAAESFERAVTLDPGDPNSAHNMVLYLLMPLGRLTAARQEADRIFALAPAWSAPLVLQAFISNVLDESAEAERHAKSAIALGFAADRPPICVVQSELALKGGRADQAADLMLPALAPFLREGGGRELCRKVYEAVLAHKQTDEVLSAIDFAAASLGTKIPSADCTGNGGLFIEWYVRFGAMDRAFAIADRIIAEREEHHPFDIFSLLTLWRPWFASFRADGRFHTLVERLGMVPYWERYGAPDGYALRNGKLVEQ